MFDFLTIYCLATGRPIAQMSDDESGLILEVHSGANLESMCLSAMRPSLTFMSVTSESLARIQDAAPRQLLAYLLNRLYAPIHLDKFGKPLNHESMLAARRMRIANWQVIESADFGDENLDTLLFMLLDLDSRFNLTKLVKPQSITGLWSTWHHAYAATLISQLTDWRSTLVNAQIKADKLAAHAKEFWSEGNRLTRLALTKSFNRVAPAKRVITEDQKVARTKKAQAAARMKATVDFLDELEAELTTRHANLQAGIDPSVASVAVANVPVAKVKILRFGAKKMEG